MLRVVEMKLYLTSAQEATLNDWLRTCCWLYNRALDHRIKAYQRRGEPVTLYQHYRMLTEWRQRIPRVSSVPADFCRDAFRRVDRGMKAFFRRLREGGKPGFPRFRPHQRYNSLERLRVCSYVCSGDMLRVPNLGLVKFRAGDQAIPGTQKVMRVIRRASGWYAQLVVEDSRPAPPKVPVASAVGVDVGLESFATLSNGEKVENPRYFRKSERKLKRIERNASRRCKGSKNRRKAVRRLARQHERVAAQRKDFAHQQSRRLVNRFDLIGFEDLNIKGLAAGVLAKSVHDAAWGMFLRFVAYKAESAGKHAIPVDPCGTSRECPGCSAVAKKSLSERIHACSCGIVLDRDEAAARVILARALEVAGETACGGNGLWTGGNAGASRPCETGSSGGATHR